MRNNVKTNETCVCSALELFFMMSADKDNCLVLDSPDKFKNCSEYLKPSQ